MTMNILICSQFPQPWKAFTFLITFCKRVSHLGTGRKTTYTSISSGNRVIRVHFLKIYVIWTGANSRFWFLFGPVFYFNIWMNITVIIVVIIINAYYAWKSSSLTTLEPLDFSCKDSGTSMMIAFSNSSLSKSITTILSRLPWPLPPLIVFFPDQVLCQE